MAAGAGGTAAAPATAVPPQPVPRWRFRGRARRPMLPVMDLKLDLDLELPPGAALSLPPLTALSLHLLSGRLWLTHRGDPDDHFVEAGSRLLLDGRGCVVENDGGVPARLRLSRRRGWRLRRAFGWVSG